MVGERKSQHEREEIMRGSETRRAKNKQEERREGMNQHLMAIRFVKTAQSGRVMAISCVFSCVRESSLFPQSSLILSIPACPARWCQRARRPLLTG